MTSYKPEETPCRGQMGGLLDWEAMASAETTESPCKDSVLVRVEAGL